MPTSQKITKDMIEEYLSSLTGGESGCPFGPEVLVYKVLGKMYALVSQTDEIPRVTVKVNPADGEVLVGRYESVTPGYYMNKKHWITIALNSELPMETVKDLADNSYRLVVAKLTKRDKEKLEGMQ